MTFPVCPVCGEMILYAPTLGLPTKITIKHDANGTHDMETEERFGRG